VTRAPVAVVVMAKAPGFAAVKSRLQPPLTADEARALATAFLLDRLDGVVALAGITPVLAFTPPEAASALRAMVPAGVRLLAQRGEGLGGRLAAVFEDLAPAHAGVLVLDCDSPTLPLGWVADGVAALASGAADVVLGPSEDGGYWSVGSRAPYPALFAGIPWSTARVLETTLGRARALGLSVRLLPRWFDVDTPDDLRRLCEDVAATGGPPRTAAVARALGARLAAGAAR
jgi:rSAM/selenodomain-associated transferase 1